MVQEADEATRQMTREEYQHYSDCRQASFTYRKGDVADVNHLYGIALTDPLCSQAFSRVSKSTGTS
jgi:hypothetical protein